MLHVGLQQLPVYLHFNRIYLQLKLTTRSRCSSTQWLARCSDWLRVNWYTSCNCWIIHSVVWKNTIHIHTDRNCSFIVSILISLNIKKIYWYSLFVIVAPWFTHIIKMLNKLMMTKQRKYDTDCSSDKKLARRDIARVITPFRVIEGYWFWTNQKPECEFLLVNNTNLILSGIIWQIPHSINQIIAFGHGGLRIHSQKPLTILP